MSKQTEMASPEDILPDVIVFLRDTLASEDLSVNANQCRLALLQRISSRDSLPFSYVDMNGNNKSTRDTESLGECYEELESSWSGSAASSNISRGYSNTLPGSGRNQRFSFFFGNSLCDTKNKELSKTCSDPAEYLTGKSWKRAITDTPSWDIRLCGRTKLRKGKRLYGRTKFRRGKRSCGRKKLRRGNPNSRDTSKRNSMLSDSDHSLSPSSGKSEDSLEIMSISASAIRYSAIKCGLLVRKEKTLFIEHSKRLWVALLGTTLFVYTSEKDSKPTYSINVDEYNARPISPMQTSKKEFGFEIVCPGKKTYQFFSSSKSDMETWILAINHSLPVPQTSSLISAMGQLPPPEDHVDAKMADCNDKRNYHRDSLRSEIVDNPAERELPSLPMFLHYDTPNPICRAVMPDGEFDLRLPSLSSSPQETFYHSIDESIAEQLARYDYPIRSDPVLKNKENFNRHTYSHEDNVYYNISGQSFEQETRENNSVVGENSKKSLSADEKENLCHKNGYSRIRQLIQKMEEINNQNNAATKKSNGHANESKLLNSQIATSKDEVYELVTAPTYVNINA